MKILLCFVFATFVVLARAMTDEQIAKVEERSKKCREETGVSKELVDKVRKGELVDEPKMRAHSFCMAKKLGLQSESGELDIDHFKEHLKDVAENDEEVEKIAKKCLVKKDTPENTAFETMKCIMDLKPNFSPVH